MVDLDRPNVPIPFLSGNQQGQFHFTEPLISRNKTWETDLVTGTPNLFQLKADMEFTLREMAVGDKFQLVIIDLDDFGKLNNKYGNYKVDEVISYIAITVQTNMKRNENIYIIRRDGGSDQFVFLRPGDEAEALGFLLRLERQFDKELTPHVSKHVLFDDCRLQFHAGVCPLDMGDTVELALDRVSECLGLARQRGSPSRVHWFSRNTDADFSGWEG